MRRTRFDHKDLVGILMQINIIRKLVPEMTYEPYRFENIELKVCSIMSIPTFSFVDTSLIMLLTYLHYADG